MLYGVQCGNVYGTSNAPPFYPGSTGGPESPSAGVGQGGWGGGLIRLEVAEKLDFHGSMTANGANYLSTAVGGVSHVATYYGGGSGAGSDVRCKPSVSAGDLVRANGGTPGPSGKGGGGGRIAIFRRVGDLPGAITWEAKAASEGASGWTNPTDGTIFFGWDPSAKGPAGQSAVAPEDVCRMSHIGAT